MRLKEKRKKALRLLEKNFKSITYSKNVFLPITNYCRNNCKYCGFTKPKKYLLRPNEAKKIIDKAKKTESKESLFVLGEKPEKNTEFMQKLDKIGYSKLPNYLKDLYEYSLEKDIIPHTNLGVVEEGFIQEIKEYNGSLGLMLESIQELEVHKDSPGKDPEKRIKTLERFGEEHIPTTTGLLIGIGETIKSRKKSLEKIRELDEKYGHIQEIIIQPYRSNKYSKNIEGCNKKELYETISLARIMFPEKGIQSPPNLSDAIELIKSGASDLGGLSEITPDYVNPQHSWPKISELEKKIPEKFDFSLKQRPPIHNEYINENWLPRKVLEALN